MNKLKLKSILLSSLLVMSLGLGAGVYAEEEGEEELDGDIFTPDENLGGAGGGRSNILVPEPVFEIIRGIEESITRINLIWEATPNPKRNFPFIPRDESVFDLGNYDPEDGIVSSGNYAGIENLNAFGIAEEIKPAAYEIPLSHVAVKAEVIRRSGSQLESHILRPKGAASNIVLKNSISSILAPKLVHLNGIRNFMLRESNSTSLDFTSTLSTAEDFEDW